MRSTPYRLLLASLAVLLLSCGNATENPDPTTPPNPNNPNTPGGDTTTYVPAPRGSTRPQAVPASAVDCGLGDAVLRGRFTAPNGTTPVAGAFVYISTGDCWAGTDKDGKFAAKGVPPGAGTVRMEKGLFQAEGSGAPGTELALKVDPAEVKLAYVVGEFDSIQVVLQRLGFTPEVLTEEQLSSAGLAAYSALFLNCGLNEFQADDPDVQQALRGYVRGGGLLYASDRAEPYVKFTFPDKVGFREDSRVGAEGEQVALVLDESLKRALGKEQATINFDAGAWVVIDSVPAGTQVLMRGPAKTLYEAVLPDRPYMVQFQEGLGRVTYTSFHNEAQPTADMNILLEQLLFRL